MKNTSIIRKLRKERKLPEEAEVFISNLSLEDLIALKLELAGKPVNGKLFGIPIWKSVPFIVREALLKTAISICKTRHESEICALNTLKSMNIDSNDLVAIHDCARSFLPEDLLKQLITEAKTYGSCSPYIETSLYSKLSQELLTDSLVEIQTPQIFEYKILQNAYIDQDEEQMTSHDTTEQVSKKLNIESKVILGSEFNLKITYKEDLETIKLKLEEYGNK